MTVNVTVTAAAGRLPGRVGPAKRACAAITMPVPPSRCQCRHHDASAAIMMPVGNFIPAQTPTAAAAAAAAGQVYDSIRADPAYKKTDKKKYEKPGKIQGKARSPPRSKSLHRHRHHYTCPPRNRRDGAARR